jgi:c-di-GMP phosphodiesterase
MQEHSQPQHSVLGQVALGYSPVVNPQRQVVATRVTVFAARGEAPPSASALLQALYSVWPVPPESDDTAAAEAGDDGPLNLTLRVVDEAAAAAAAVAASKAAKAAEAAKYAAKQAAKLALEKGIAPARLVVAAPAVVAGANTANPQLLLTSLPGNELGGMPVPASLLRKPRDPKAPLPPLALNVADEALLRDVLAALLSETASETACTPPATQLMVEVPSFIAADPTLHRTLQSLHQRGMVLLIKGKPLQSLPPDVLACFVHAVVEDQAEREALPASTSHGTFSHLQSGVRSSAQTAQAFEQGARAVMGWPLEDPLPLPNGRSKVPSDVQVVMELIKGVDREQPVAKLEDLLKRDPTVAFRLMRYINSPAFGMSVEINSFGHAVMLLGYQRLKRWLALLMASSCKGVNAQPLMHAAVRRGFLMEELARSQGDAEVRGEMFICGIFSLLDRLLQQPFADMLASIPVPERVQQAVLGEGGPYGRYLDLVCAIEQDAVFDIRENADALMLGLSEVNHAVLRALLAARQLDG